MLSFFYPARCPGCDAVLPPGEGEYKRICPECLKKLPVVRDPFCMKCGCQLLKEEDVFCSRCVAGGHPFKSGRSLFVYDADMKQMMYRFKYSGRREYAVFFADAAYKLRGNWIREQKPELIIPVPMYPAKKRKRGYNQAEDIASELVKITGIQSCPRMVVREKNTKALKGLTAEERKKQLEGAFLTDRDELKSFLEKNRPARFLLVDDIFTTGTTVDAVTGALKAGTRKLCGEEAEVSVLTVCIGEDA